MKSLLEMPADILSHLLPYLNEGDLFALLMSCKTLKNKVGATKNEANKKLLSQLPTFYQNRRTVMMANYWALHEQRKIDPKAGPAISPFSVFKVILLGWIVGKSALLRRYISGNFSDGGCHATIGMDFTVKKLLVEQTEQFQSLWDSSATIKEREIAVYLPNSQWVILCFDLTDRRTFQELDAQLHWARKYAPHSAPISLVGTKADLTNERAVTREEAQNWCDANKLAHYTECSAKTGEGVGEIFIHVAQASHQRLVSYRLNDYEKLPENERIPALLYAIKAKAFTLEELRELKQSASKLFPKLEEWLSVYTHLLDPKKTLAECLAHILSIDRQHHRRKSHFDFIDNLRELLANSRLFNIDRNKRLFTHVLCPSTENKEKYEHNGNYGDNENKTLRHKILIDDVAAESINIGTISQSELIDLYMLAEIFSRTQWCNALRPRLNIDSFTSEQQDYINELLSPLADNPDFSETLKRFACTSPKVNYAAIGN